MNHWLIRPSVEYTIATDWITNRCLKWCFMYSRKNRKIFLFLTAFLGYVLPYGQMSLWGYQNSLRCLNKNFLYLYKLDKFFIYFILLVMENRIIRYKSWQRIGPHNHDILSIIFGSLLGDGHAEKRSGGFGTRITFYQEGSHIEYILWLHNLISSIGYCNSVPPILNTRIGKGGKLRKIARFRTWTYTSFNWIHDLWYDKGIKKVPSCIGKYLTPLALAIWIMDDGTKVSKGLKLCTNSFTYDDCILLTKVLYNNFSIKASVQSAGDKMKNQYIIYIWKESMDTLRSIIGDFIIPEMKYKII